MGWQMTFDSKGFTAQPEDKAWAWGLELESDADTPVRTSAPEADKNARATLTIPRTAKITEWFINDQRGLEQGWTLSAPAEIRLRVRGNLKPSVTPQSISFGGQLTYSGLKAWDATGKTVPTHFEATAEGFAVRYDDASAQYPITIDPIAQQAYLKASNTGGGDISRPGDSFGHSVAVSGDTAVIGAPGEASNATGVNGNQADNSAPGSGAAYVFTRSGSIWTQQAYLKAGNTGAYGFGTSVALAGDTLVIGAPLAFSNGPYSGAAYVFTRSAGVWTQQDYLQASNTEGFDYFGQSVALSGDTVVIGAIGEASNATGVNGNQADNSALNSGAAYVFTRNGSTWTQQAYLKASNSGAEDWFGVSVAVSDDTVVIGAPVEASNAAGVNSNQVDNSASYSGAAYVFTRSGSTWTQQAYLKASNSEANDYFGVSVAVSGDTALIGAFGEASSAIGVGGNQTNNSAPNSGAAYVFSRSAGVWSQQAYLKASNSGADDYFGWSVALSDRTAIIGAYGESSSATGVAGDGTNNSAYQSGAAYVFTRSGTAWTQQAYLKASNTGEFDSFGRAVAVSGDTAVIGAYLEDSSATGVNGNQADDSASASGAAYVFSDLGSAPPPTVTGISPTSGSAAGGASVTITGTGFTGATGVTFGIVMATGVTVVNDTTITCITPAGSTGAASVVVTAPGGSNTPNTLFTYTGTGPLAALEAYLKSGNTEAEDLLGYSVAISGDTAVIGAPYEDSNATGVNGNQADNSALYSGAAYVFTRGAGGWTQQAYLKASNTEAEDFFGISVAVSGDTVIIGASGESSNATGVNGNQADNSTISSGAAYVFVRSGSTWTQQAYLKASNTEAGDSFGSSVAVSGDTAVIVAGGEDSNATGVGGNQTDNSAGTSGAAYVFTRSGGTWTQQAYLKASNTGSDDQFGNSVAVSGNTVVIGAPYEASAATGVGGDQADNSAPFSGATYVFSRRGSTWTQQAYLKASNTGWNDEFGRSVAVSGDTVVIGAPYEDSNATSVNGNQGDNSLGFAGAAYVFTRSGSTWTQQAYLKASNTGAGDVFGSKVAVSGDTAVIGASGEYSNATGVGGNQADNSAIQSGAAYVFTRSGNTWTQQAYLKASNTGLGDAFGRSVAVSGNTVVIGAPYEDNNATGVNGNQADNSAADSGAAYTFTLPAVLTPAQVFDAAMTTAGLSGPNAALSATPYGDGVPNLLKYAFNLNLSGPDVATMTLGGSSGLPGITAQPNGGASVFRFEFLRRKNSGLIYTPQKSGELANPASWVPLTDSPTVISIDATWERVIYEEPYDAATIPKCFGRVQVTLP
jgi:hypothetical protein